MSDESAKNNISPDPTLFRKSEENIAKGEYDVFLCYKSEDKLAVKNIGNQLKDWGIAPWLDMWDILPGRPWQREIEKQIETIPSAAVFVGQVGMGPWQQLEIEAFLREFVRRGCPVIPVVLPDATNKPKLPPFLEGMQWVDFRTSDPHPLEGLIWGITGKRISIR
jgi:hypothetical protein